MRQTSNFNPVPNAGESVAPQNGNNQTQTTILEGGIQSQRSNTQNEYLQAISRNNSQVSGLQNDTVSVGAGTFQFENGNEEFTNLSTG